MDIAQILDELQKKADPKVKQSLARFGIESSKALGVRIPNLRKLGKAVGKNHELSLELWATGIHEARILASMVDDPNKVTSKQMDNWVLDFNSWDLCDQVCLNLFDRTEFRFEKAMEYSLRKPEFEKRAGFALVACLAVHDKKATDLRFEPFIQRIEAEADDPRNFVKKAVNWALRQMGKRNQNLHSQALELSHRLQQTNSKSAKWIARNAIRELESPKIRQKFG